MEEIGTFDLAFSAANKAVLFKPVDSCNVSFGNVGGAVPQFSAKSGSVACPSGSRDLPSMGFRIGEFFERSGDSTDEGRGVETEPRADRISTLSRRYQMSTSVPL